MTSCDHLLEGGLETALFERLRDAVEIARAAGRQLVAHLEQRGDDETTLEYKGRRELVTPADRASEELIVAAIRERFAEDAVLAEEGVASPKGVADREAEYLWVIDPLDGTTNFVHDHPHWAVSLGILRRGEPCLGVVHAPRLGGRDGGETYYGAVDHGAWLDGRRLRVSRTESLREAIVATGFAYNRNEAGVNTNAENFARVLMEVRGLRRCGSAALDLAYVARGIYDGFWEMYLAPYDVAAGIALILGAGGSVDDLGSGEGAVFGQEILCGNTRIESELRTLVQGRP